MNKAVDTIATDLVSGVKTAQTNAKTILSKRHQRRSHHIARAASPVNFTPVDAKTIASAIQTAIQQQVVDKATSTIAQIASSDFVALAGHPVNANAIMNEISGTKLVSDIQTGLAPVLKTVTASSMLSSVVSTLKSSPAMSQLTSGVNAVEAPVDDLAGQLSTGVSSLASGLDSITSFTALENLLTSNAVVKQLDSALSNNLSAAKIANLVSASAVESELTSAINSLL